MKYIKGDLIRLALAGKFDVIIHGCNCFCTMEAGIAKQIQQAFPAAYEADLSTASGDKKKLGTYSKAKIETAHANFFVINGYTQYHWAGQGVLADYEAIERLFSRLNRDFPERRFGYPKIGAGLAGGDWQIIKTVIDRAMGPQDHTLVEFSSR